MTIGNSLDNTHAEQEQEDWRNVADAFAIGYSIVAMNEDTRDYSEQLDWLAQVAPALGRLQAADPDWRSTYRDLIDRGIRTALVDRGLASAVPEGGQADD